MKKAKPSIIAPKLAALKTAILKKRQLDVVYDIFIADSLLRQAKKALVAAFQRSKQRTNRIVASFRNEAIVIPETLLQNSDTQ